MTIIMTVFGNGNDSYSKERIRHARTAPNQEIPNSDSLIRHHMHVHWMSFPKRERLYRTGFLSPFGTRFRAAPRRIHPSHPEPGRFFVVSPDGEQRKTVYCGVELKAAPEGEWKWDGRTSGLDVGIDCSEIRPGETKEFTLSADSSLKDTRSRLVVFLFRYVRYQESTYEQWRTNVFFGHPEQTEFAIDTIRW
jgi:hypothetical protein